MVKSHELGPLPVAFRPLPYSKTLSGVFSSRFLIVEFRLGFIRDLVKEKSPKLNKKPNSNGGNNSAFSNSTHFTKENYTQNNGDNYERDVIEDFLP